MKKNLLYGIIGGAAVGAAASYLMGANERKNLVSGLKNLSGTVTSMGGLLGSESESNNTGSSERTSSAGSKSASKSGGNKSGSASSRRG